MSKKRLLIILVVAFFVYWMFTSSGSLAHDIKQVAHQGWKLLVNLFNALIRFLEKLNE